MDNDTKNGPEPPLPADLVVIDRAVLRQALEAVVHTLESTRRLEELRAEGQVDKVTYVELGLQLRQARDALAEGLSRVLSSLDELPPVEFKTPD